MHDDTTDDIHPFFLDDWIETPDDPRWSHLRDQRKALRELENICTLAAFAHPATRAAAQVARCAAWLLEPVPLGGHGKVLTRFGYLARIGAGVSAGALFALVIYLGAKHA